MLFANSSEVILAVSRSKAIYFSSKLSPSFVLARKCLMRINNQMYKEIINGTESMKSAVLMTRSGDDGHLKYHQKLLFARYPLVD